MSDKPYQETSSEYRARWRKVEQYVRGFNDAIAAAAKLHEDIDLGDYKKAIPGCDVMGAIIEYRDKIRELKP